MFSVSQAALRLGVCSKTIRRWDTRGHIHCLRTPGDHRRITLFEVNRLLGKLHRETIETPSRKKCAIYARVSGHKQKTDGDLDRQLKRLTVHCRKQFNTRPIVFTDIGSGLNMKRRGLRRLLDIARRGVIDTLLVTHKDRLARFGTELIIKTLEDYGVNVMILNEEKDMTPQEELVADMLSLSASFSGRVYGLRAAQLRRTTIDSEYIEIQFVCL